MSNLIPPLVSSSPPPMVTDEPEDLEDDEFGDFTAAADLSFEGYSLPTTPQHASFSNLTSNSFQTSSNLIISPKMKSHLETNKVSENIFCDIKDVNTTFVNNNKSDEISNDNIAKQDVQSKTEDFEVIVPRIKKTLETTTSQRNEYDKKDDQETKNDDFGDFNCFSSDLESTEKLQKDENDSAKINLNVKSESDLNEFNNGSIIETQEIIVPNNETIIEKESKVLEIKSSEGGLDISNSIMESDNTESKSVEHSDLSDKVLDTVDTKSDDKTSKFCVNEKLQEILSDTEDFGDFENTVDILKSNPVEEVKSVDSVSTNIQSRENNLGESTENKHTNVENKQINEENKRINEEIKHTSEEISQTIAEKRQTTTGDELQTVDDEFSDFTFTPTQNDITNHTSEKIESLDDKFTNFSSPIIKNKLTENNIVTEEITNEDDDFGDINLSSKIEIVNSKKSSEETKHTEDDFGDFNLHSNIEETPIADKDKHEYDEFGDFSFTPKVQETRNEKSHDEDFDEFGDFNDYTQETVEFTTNFDMSSTESAANAEKVINDIFTDNELDLPDIEVINFIETTIFKQLHDIENTNALNYQWATSDSQKSLLMALNIDSRNILFGPRWNASMPRFAANLGFTPLEPVKSDIPGPGAPGASAAAPMSAASPEPTNCEVPAAKFDWTSSGLVNPLDYIPIIYPSQHQNQDADTLNLNLDSWDFWLQTQTIETVKQESLEDKLNLNQPETRRYSSENSVVAHLDLNILNNFGSDNESVNSLKFIEAPAEIDESKPEPEVLDQISNAEDDFSSFQSTRPEKENTWRPTLIPQKVQLKESHISSEQIENKVLNIQQFELESTIVTPELARKNLNVQGVEDDEFADFQMSLPQETQKSDSVGPVPQETSKKSSLPQEPTPKSDFIGTVSLEPLKPIVLEPVISKTPAKINWPEPGIINESIGDFDFTYISENKIPEQENPVKPEVKTEEKTETVAEEDDWSDFVCAQHPGKTVPSKNKTSTLFNMSNNQSSHLELSVPNLQNTHMTNKTVFIPNSSPTKTATQQIGYNNYQPPYQIPLQTINTPFGGLPQTSLSTYNNFTIGPTELTQNLPQKNRNDFGIFDGPFNPEIKPFQAYNPPNLVNNPVQPEFQMNYPLQSVESTFLKMQQPSKEFLNSKEDDDDDWTDFVSSQPVNQTNGFGQEKPGNNYNIITNPVHFDAFQSFQSSSTDRTVNSKMSGNLNQKSSVPSISALPELDFIAPKNKFFSKK